MTGERTNDDRAEGVREMVQQYHDENYWHPAGEPWSTVIMDTVCDLMHLYDRLPASENEYAALTGGLDSAEAMIERAVDHYEEELAEACTT